MDSILFSSLNRTDVYISPEELKRYDVVTIPGSDTEDKRGTPIGKQGLSYVLFDLWESLDVHRKIMG